MAIGWLAVLQSVPWSEVVRNAPKVAAGAKKLWNSASNKPVPVKVPGTTPEAGASPAVSLSALRADIAELQAATADQHEQLRESSELIKELSEQNTQLIARLEALRVRLSRMTAALAVVGLGAAAAIALALR
jgi:hypothetical protein